MKFQRILAAVYNTPLGITQAGFETVEAVLRPHLLKGELPDKIKSEAQKDIWGEPLPEMVIDGDCAVIPVFGVLIQHASLLDKQCGACSYDDIRANLLSAQKQGCDYAVLNINSPGGEVCGCLETAQLIARLIDEGMEIYAYTDTMICSCAYFLASACSGIFATASSQVGCIGCLIGLLDVSKAFEAAGLKAEFIVSGKYKSTGGRGTSLSDEQRGYLQGLVDESANTFKAFVQEHRDNVPDDAMEGQCFHADNGAEKGLVDGIVQDMDEVMEMMEEAP